MATKNETVTNRISLKDPVVSHALSTTKMYADGAASIDSFLQALHTLRRTKFVSVLVVLLSAIVAGVFGWRTEVGKRIAVQVIEALDPTFDAAPDFVRDLWIRIFRKISKKQLQEQARAQGIARFARAFASLWRYILGALVALGLSAGLGTVVRGTMYTHQHSLTAANRHLMRGIDHLRPGKYKKILKFKPKDTPTSKNISRRYDELERKVRQKRFDRQGRGYLRNTNKARLNDWQKARSTLQKLTYLPNNRTRGFGGFRSNDYTIAYNPKHNTTWKPVPKGTKIVRHKHYGEVERRKYARN
jgi:hypothetical protein